MKIIQPIRYTITYQVLEAAKDNNDAFVIAACRRCLNAWRIGRKAPQDFAIVMAFAA
jgi:hypothetical protein